MVTLRFLARCSVSDAGPPIELRDSCCELVSDQVMHSARFSVSEAGPPIEFTDSRCELVSDQVSRTGCCSGWSWPVGGSSGVGSRLPDSEGEADS